MPVVDFILTLLTVVFSIQCISSANTFLKTKDPKVYVMAKNRSRTARVFFTLTCIKLVLGMLIIFYIAILSSESEMYDVIVSLISLFILSGFFTVAAFILGVAAIIKFRQAEKVYAALGPIPVSNAIPTNNMSGTNYRNANYPASNNGPSNSYNTSGSNDRGSYQPNVYANDPGQLRSSTRDQTPFEAPPPNYNNYNYGNGSYRPPQTGGNAYNNSQNIRQKPPAQTQSNTADYSGPPFKENANTGKAEPKQHVSNMPEVKPLSEAKPVPSAAVPEKGDAAANPPEAMPSAPERPAVPVPVIPPAAYEIKKENVVRCKHCGVSNKEGDKFCTFCGKSLS